ncbi:citrate lyase subunit alpha [Marinobacterium rhizophilum]|uniref:citrate lyase subunit alpha n=1 Tax=Marinobacterium rhizophilum TaxID=420402 RepID=UPI0003A52371|nr:citrate lyase subunit alpha [Marinobacterium rhizophilum]
MHINRASIGKPSGTIKDALLAASVKDGQVISFQHHLRNGDLVLLQVLEALKELGVKNITIAPTAIMQAHARLTEFIADGTVSKIYTNYLTGDVARYISEGRMAEPVIMQSHGGRAGSIVNGRLKVDVTFVAAPSVDSNGSVLASGIQSCAPLGYSITDALYAKYTVAVTDNVIAERKDTYEISHKYIDYIAVVSSIGDANKINSGSTVPAVDSKSLAISNNVVKVITNSSLFRNGFSYQAGAGGISLNVINSLSKLMTERQVVAGFLAGGIMSSHVQMLREGLVQKLYNVQSFDNAAVDSYGLDPAHLRMSVHDYANPFNRLSIANRLDFAAVGATEVDLDFNVNVVTGFDNVIRGGSGGHIDICAGSDISIVTTRLHAKGRPKIVRSVNTIVTPGKYIDIIATDVGVAINPRREDLKRQLSNCSIDIVDMSCLFDLASSGLENDTEAEKSEKIVAVIEDQFGNVIDYIYANDVM